MALPQTVRNYVEEWSLLAEVEVQFDTLGLDRVHLPAEVEIVLDRITQEGMGFDKPDN